MLTKVLNRKTAAGVTFTLPNAPADFREIVWRAEFSERGLKSLSFEKPPSGWDMPSAGKSAGEDKQLSAKQKTQLQRLKSNLLSRLRGGEDDYQWSDFDLADTGEFHQRVWQAMREIPAGQTATYSEVAASAGSPFAFRACGQACGANRILIFIPCHRVVSSSGPGGFGYGLEWKRKFLAMEGNEMEAVR